MRTVFMICVALLLCAGCVKSDVTRTGNTYPPRPEGCEVEVLDDAPEYPYEKVGEAEIQCHESEGREVCVDRLRATACELGAHAIYEIHEGEGVGYSAITAWFARKKDTEGGEQPSAEPEGDAAAGEAQAEAPAGDADTEDGSDGETAADAVEAATEPGDDAGDDEPQADDTAP
jgi:hypothetical protein